MEKSTLHSKVINGTPLLIPNKITKKNDEFYISYNNKDIGVYGSSTTALHINKTGQFLILNGDHSDNYKQLETLSECIKYFYDNIAKANPRSEHGTVFKIAENGKAKYIKGGY